MKTKDSDSVLRTVNPREQQPVKDRPPQEGDLRVWWIPQIPMKQFWVNVRSPREGKLLCDALADYDIFQFENKIKPDYCNAGGLCVFEDGEWIDWYDEDGNELDDSPLAQ